MAGPLPILTRTGHAPRLVAGFWRAWVENPSAPYAVSVPTLYGSGRAVPCEVVADVLTPGPLSKGQPVWVTCVEGVTSDLVITGRRQ